MRKPRDSADEKTLWDRAKKAMEEAEILPATQKRAAKLLGIKQPSISEWNTKGSKGGAKIENVRKLALETHVCVEWLYTGRGPKWPGPPEDPIALKLWSIWHSLPDEAKLEAFEAAVKWRERALNQTAPISQNRGDRSAGEKS